MDPFYQSTPTSTGRFAPGEGVDLYFERRGRPESPEKVVLIMGALATLHHFDQLADLVAASEGGSTFDVLTYDHRGIGRSTLAADLKLTTQTSEILAKDALALLEHVWAGEPATSRPVHVYGASMGGMVAQQLAVDLLTQKHSVKVKTLVLAVTARSYGLARFVPLGPSVYRALFPWVLPSDPSKMIADLLPKCFEKTFLESLHSSGRSHQDLFQERWVREYSDWFAFSDLDACAAQSTVAGRHRLTDEQARVLRESGTPILVAIAEKDSLMSPAAQYELARILDAKTSISTGGHMGSQRSFGEFAKAIVAHFIKR